MESGYYGTYHVTSVGSCSRYDIACELVQILGIPKANVSQHLSIMKLKGILKSRREGVNIYYRIANQKVVDACALMREVLNEIVYERSKIAEMISNS
ncbi:MAG: ArsR family transcriptional regulator [Nitrospirales bacterium]|nr:ArsR family transcriptional regulator [Nitrospirales bacterium]